MGCRFFATFNMLEAVLWDRGKPDIPLLECDVKDWTLSGADGSSREAKKMVIVVTFRHS